MPITGSPQPSPALPPLRSNTTGHARRTSRSKSSLETLLEGEPENGKPAAARVAPKAAPVQSAPRTRPTSSVMSLQTQSHMPRSIFPEVPASRRASTVPVSTSASTFNTVPNAYVPARYQMSRRHTYLAPAPAPAPGPRRDPRPLRSSPLAGPSLALSDDGTLTGSDESADQERRFKPNRISSTPDISTSTLMKLEGRVAASAPPSPRGTLRGVPPPTTLTPETTPQTADEPQAPTPDPPPSPARNSSMRRLANGLKRLSSLSAAPKPSGSESTSPTSSTPGASRPRSQTFSGAAVQSEDSPVPPVPSIPTWAKSSPNADAAPAAEASTSAAAAEPTPSAKPIFRRPSTAPSSPSLLTGSLSRRSSVYGSHETLPSARTPQPPSPSSSTPEQNWLLTSASPRFSRLGLKAEGVVLPLTAKEVRRRSTIRVSSTDGADSRSITGTLRSKRSQASLAASTIAEDDVRPPAPAFRRAASASSASVASTASAESDVQTTPSLSRASSESGGSAEEVRTPRDGAQTEFGVLTPGAKEQGQGPAGVELRVNDVTVEIIDLQDKAERVRASPRAPADASAEKAKRAVPERRNTLKRVWRKLTGGAKG